MRSRCGVQLELSHGLTRRFYAWDPSPHCLLGLPSQAASWQSHPDGLARFPLRRLLCTSEKNMNRIELFRETILFQLGPVPVTRTMVTSLAVSLILIVAAGFLRRAAVLRPLSTVGILAELSVTWLDRLVLSVVGHPAPGLVVFAGSLFYFIAACAIAGQLPAVRTPTADLATTSALALIVFFAVPVSGIRSKGLRRYLLSYVRPSFIMLPFHIMSELSRTFALSVRLFGNMMSGQLIVALLVALAGLFVPMPLMALDLLIGILQAYIFAVLATVYVGAAIRIGEESS
jgi:F-type H+-transporting ATPase subunit a